MTRDQILDMTAGELRELDGQDSYLEPRARLAYWSDLATMTTDQLSRELNCHPAFAAWVQGIASNVARHLREVAG